VSKTSQSASIECSKRPIKKRLDALPIEYTSYRRKRRERRKREQRKDRNRGMQKEMPVHVKRQKNTDMWWRRERQRE